jgi:hypothetical protein
LEEDAFGQIDDWMFQKSIQTLERLQLHIEQALIMRRVEN